MKIKQVGTALPAGATLWRYFDFQKFLSFAISESIFFNRMDKMEDTNEGISMNQVMLRYGSEVEKKLALLEKEKGKRKELQLKERQQKYFLSCWLIHHRESVAMWNSYSDDNGIAIRVNSKHLIESILQNSEGSEHCEKMKSLYYGKVVYKDFFKEKDRHAFKEEIEIIGFQKDVCYEYESEYRFLFKQDLHKFKSHDISHINLKLPNFKKIHFDLIFHPKMEKWKQENIKDVLAALKAENIHAKESELQLKGWGNGN